ncbi:olfactory receptor 5AR1-like [Alligator mississippiensis]|uniref:olfactory receptor 5AR1-like n=1 Tax=Alligator mississippiensis TaxID=8496 RepID=UPI0003D0C420|nr:olfactory receptor 5AR1-like [Alligator mississippiensis]
MAEGNDSEVTEFILLGLMDHPKLRVTFFVMFLVIYAVSIMGNLGMIILFRANSQLHTPMYFFLSHLSFVDMCCTSTITPKMLATFYSDGKSISFSGCIVQMFLCAEFVTVEAIMLSVMAYDRYMAVCYPLLYSTVMSHMVCLRLVTGSYIAALTSAIVQVSCTFSLSFCGSNKIQHFFCDIHPLLKLSCTDTHINEIMLFVFATLIGLSTSLEIFISYAYILYTILQIHSAEHRSKAFSTCASHLTAVTIFYGTALFTYLRPSTLDSLEHNKVASVFYTVVIPMLNPLIYSLRNKEVKEAFRKGISRNINLGNCV